MTNSLSWCTCNTTDGECSMYVNASRSPTRSTSRVRLGAEWMSRKPYPHSGCYHLSGDMPHTSLTRITDTTRLHM